MKWLSGKSRQDGSLVEECEAFLGGRYGDVAMAKTKLPPSWVWLNQLAHLNDAGLAELAGGHGGSAGSSPSARWLRATSFLAGELLRAAQGDPDDARRLQSEVLVPLELKWMAGDSATRTPQDLVHVVLGGLSRAGARESERRRTT